MTENSSIVTSKGLVQLDFKSRTIELLMLQPLDAAYYLHSQIYLHNPDIKAICHTHSNSVSALTSIKDFKLEMVHQNSCRFYANLAYDREYGGIATSQSEEGARIAKIIKGNEGSSQTQPNYELHIISVLLLANHGVIVASTHLAVAFDHTYYIERAALVQLQMQNSSSNKISDDVAEMTFNQLENNKLAFAQVHLNSFINKFQSDF